MFIHVVKSIVTHDAKTSDVSFYPSLVELQNPEMDIAEGHVLVSSARAVLQWLGITSKRDIRRVLCRKHTHRDGVDVLRVLGGLQCGEDSDASPVRVILGKSFAAQCLAKESDAGVDADVVEFETGTWDSSNNMLSPTPITAQYRTGNYHRAREWDTEFTLSWVWTGGYYGRAFTSHSKKTGSVRVGRVSLSMPTVTFRGYKFAADLCNLVADELLDRCS